MAVLIINNTGLLFRSIKTTSNAQSTSAAISSTRTAAVLLQTLRAKELIRIARIEALRHIIGEMRQKGKMYVLPLIVRF